MKSESICSEKVNVYMKNAIKVLCFTLAVIIVAVSSFLIYFKWDKTDFEYVDSTEKGEVIITAYKGDSKNIIIPSKIRGKKYPVDSSSVYKFNNNKLYRLGAHEEEVKPL